MMNTRSIAQSDYDPSLIREIRGDILYGCVLLFRHSHLLNYCPRLLHDGDLLRRARRCLLMLLQLLLRQELRAAAAGDDGRCRDPTTATADLLGRTSSRLLPSRCGRGTTLLVNDLLVLSDPALRDKTFSAQLAVVVLDAKVLMFGLLVLVQIVLLGRAVVALVTPVYI
jgi:hypothetical protein